MESEIIAARAEGSFDLAVERTERANEALRALLRSGYRSTTETIGEGVLLHHDGDGPDLVLYPDGSLHPVGLYRASPPSPRNRRSFGKLFKSAAKWVLLIGFVLSFWILSLALWSTIISET